MITSRTVSELNEQIKSLLESTFIQIRVEGEISKITYHSSGHIYFTIKDAKSALDCVIFRSNARNLKFRLEAGQHVILGGSITVYVPRGNYQMMVQNVEPYGEGALSLAYEQLKKRLQSEGLFAAENKKSIPKNIHHIAVVTSKTGAAIQDMIRVATNRWPLLKITLIDSLVQGEGAANEIARHIAYADSLNADIIIVGRGGGSLEDLWAFNEEVVARAIAACKTPVVSAVGHEVDTMISDFVADMRAPTPSAAMEQVLPDRVEVFYTIDGYMEQLSRQMSQIVFQKERVLTHLSQQIKQHAISRRIEIQIDDTKRLMKELTHTIFYTMERKKEQLKSLQDRMLSLNPSLKLRSGFVQLVKNDKTTSLETLEKGDEASLQDDKFIVKVRVLDKKEYP